MKFNVFALALICALSVAPVVAKETAPVAKKAEVKKEAPKATEVETAVAAKDVEVTETKAVTETPAADAKATDACPSCK